MTPSLLTMLLCGLGLGISITNFVWARHVNKINQDWVEYLTSLIDDFYHEHD